MKKNNQLILANEWFAKAGDDELSGEAILKENGAPGTLCFLSQQMAEKYLKGAAIFFGIKVEKIHDLMRLADSLVGKIPEMKNRAKDFSILNRYYIETRYPGESGIFDWKEAKKAFEIAKTIKEIILKAVNF